MNIWIDTQTGEAVLISEMTDEYLVRVVNFLRKKKEEIIKSYEDLLKVDLSYTARAEVKTELFFLRSSDIENVATQGRALLEEAEKRNLL